MKAIANTIINIIVGSVSEKFLPTYTNGYLITFWKNVESHVGQQIKYNIQWIITSKINEDFKNKN